MPHGPVQSVSSAGRLHDRGRAHGRFRGGASSESVAMDHAGRGCGHPEGGARTRPRTPCLFFKDAMLGRFYAICNCCSCCCGAMQAQRNGIPMLASSGYAARIDEDLCNQCGTCSDACPFGMIFIIDGLPRIAPSDCMGCGVCVSKCPSGAITLRRDLSKSEPLELFTLMKNALCEERGLS